MINEYDKEYIKVKGISWSKNTNSFYKGEAYTNQKENIKKAIKNLKYNK